MSVRAIERNDTAKMSVVKCIMYYEKLLYSIRQLANACSSCVYTDMHMYQFCLVTEGYAFYFGLYHRLM